jgi:uncharacterized protein (UPF0335 family)
MKFRTERDEMQR